MTYKEHQKKYKDKVLGQVHIEREIEFVDRDFYRDSDEREVIDKGWRIYLEHSCDEWVIGTPQQAREMARDMKEAADWCEANP